MEYIVLFFFVWVVVCLPAIIFTAVANSRRRGEAAALDERITSLARQVENLERRLRAESAHAAPSAMAPAPSVPQAPAMKISAEETRAAAPSHVEPAPMRELVFLKEPPATSVAPPPVIAPPVLAPPAAAQAQAHAPSKLQPQAQPHPPAQPPKSMEPAIAPPPPGMQPPQVPGIAASSAAQVPGIAASSVATVPPAQRAAAGAPPYPPSVAPVPERAAAAISTMNTPPARSAASSAQVRSTPGLSGFHASEAAVPPAPPKPKVSMEETLGTWLLRIAISSIVIGVGFLIAAKWGSFAPWLRVMIVCSGGAAMLGGGIFAERKERYQTLGRALIGGGWAVIATVTYGLRHAPFIAVLPSDAADLVLLSLVVAAMVWHTLRYNSQLVTGAAFLLGFSAITLNPDPPYNLIAGALLVSGMTVIVHRYRWWELEVFGILASYLNHFYWLYTIFGLEPRRAPFPHHGISVVLVIAYWAVFRLSYVLRQVENDEEEKVSTIAALLNPLLFLAVMKYQSFHPEWAFYGLLGLGAVEFLLGQLPRSRERVAPFQVLSSLGAALMVAAVPFRYSGDALEVLWLAGAEAFLLAGIFVRERLFRGFGIIVSALVVLATLMYRVVPLAQKVLDGQTDYQPALGMVLLAIALVLYANAHVVRRLWPKLFAEELETQALKTLSFAAGVMAVGAIYAFANHTAVPIVLALFVAVLTVLGRQFVENDLIYQAHWIAAVTFMQTIGSGAGLELRWNNIPERVLVFAPVAGLLYLSSRHVRLSQANYNTFFSGLYTWGATALLATLIWMQAPAAWIGLGWILLAVALGTAARLLKVRSLLWQTHTLSALAAAWTLYAGFALVPRGSRVQLISVGATALLLYLLNWITNIAGLIEDERISQAYSWAGSLLVSWLIWYQMQPVSVSLAWGVFGLLLFEVGNARSWTFLRLQAYVALVCSFAHMFYSNFNALSAPGSLSPDVVTVLLLVPVYFWIYWQLRRGKGRIEGKVRVEYLLACLGTATLAALARFELPQDWVVVGYAAIMLAVLLVAYLARLEIFLYQGMALLGVTAFRLSMHNFYHLQETYSSNLSCAIWALALMAVSVPLCLMIRRVMAKTIGVPGWLGTLAMHPEQPMFFVPFALLGVLLYLKVVPGMVTLAWCAEAVMVYVLALWARERSFRLAGLGLLVACAVKIMCWDAWQLNDPTARYLTLIGVGALILVVYYLMMRNREALREYL